MKEPEKKEFLDRVGRLLASQGVGVLATDYHHTPHQSLIAYICSEDLREIFFITPTYTRKVEAMEENPHVALLVDNRRNMASDFDACVAVTAKGTAETLSESVRRAFLPRYLEKHPYLEEFSVSPSCSYYHILVESYTLVSSFQRVEVLPLR